MPLRRVLSDWGIPFGLGCMVVAFAAGSGSEPWVKRTGLDARWAVLILVCAAALFVALRQLWLARSLPPRGLLRFGALAGSFLALAVVSTAWSVAPRLSVERAGSLGILFVLAAALASSPAADVRARMRLFQGLGAGAIAVAVLGLLVLALDPDAAAINASQSSTWRYEGFTENPNTIGILAGVALPILAGLALSSRSRRRQTAWVAGALLMLASLIAAESRGGLLAACAGTLVVTAFAVQGRRHRVAAVTAVVVVFAGGLALRQVAEPPAPTFASAVQAPRPLVPKSPTATPSSPGKPGKANKSTKGKSGKAAHPGAPAPQAPAPRVIKLRAKPQELPREEDEIGHPALSKQATTTVASGRLAAWKGTLELIADRPIVGYGFGTEAKVFVDRWIFFQGATPENSYLGLLLQLGGIGLALVAAMGLALAVGGVRAVRSREGDERTLVLMQLGVLVAASGIMLIQSYLYSVGNIVTATVWISFFALGRVALEPRPAMAPRRATAPHEVVA